MIKEYKKYARVDWLEPEDRALLRVFLYANANARKFLENLALDCIDFINHKTPELVFCAPFEMFKKHDLEIEAIEDSFNEYFYVDELCRLRIRRKFLIAAEEIAEEIARKEYESTCYN